jgi:hypothetical protein
MTNGITVRDNASSHSYDALVDGRVVGTLVYQLEGRRTVLMHTIVVPEFRGRGIGTKLVRDALDDVRAKGMTVTNYCGFVSAFIGARPEYADLIDAVHPGHVPRM